jgi:hypothetical protein
MGGLSGLFKGIGKFFKKIGRGIKKVVKKIGKGIGKLGIIGQVGMMFLMPYAGSMIFKGLLKLAPGVLSTSASLAGTKFGVAGLTKLGSALTATGANPFQIAIGKIVQGAAVTGRAFNSITGLINGGATKAIGTTAESYAEGARRLSGITPTGFNTGLPEVTATGYPSLVSRPTFSPEGVTPTAVPLLEGPTALPKPSLLSKGKEILSRTKDAVVTGLFHRAEDFARYGGGEDSDSYGTSVSHGDLSTPKPYLEQFPYGQFATHATLAPLYQNMDFGYPTQKER